MVIIENMDHFFNACITLISGSVQDFSFLPVLSSLGQTGFFFLATEGWISENREFAFHCV